MVGLHSHHRRAGLDSKFPRKALLALEGLLILVTWNTARSRGPEVPSLSLQTQAQAWPASGRWGRGGPVSSADPTPGHPGKWWAAVP